MSGAGRLRTRLARHAWVLLCLTATGQAASGEAADYPDLVPPAHEAHALIDASPAIRGARTLQQERLAHAAGLRSGPGEWVAGVTTQRRTDTTGQQFSEQAYQLGREFRLPGKYLLDRQRAVLQETLGDAEFRDAWHEAARSLLAAWFNWLRATRHRDLAGHESALAQEYARQVERRVELGDSAPVDANAAQAAASRARAQLLEAEGAVALARRTALEAFPSLSLREPRQWPDPVLPAGPADSWIDRIRGHNHEIDMGDSAAAAASLDARRARQDRLPDPRIVVHFSNNFDQDRRQLGLEVSIPLGGARRRHAATLEAGRAERAALEAEQVRRRVGMEAEDLVADASRRHERWQALASAADLAQALARRTQRGQELGEYTVADVVLARSRAGEAALAQALAALDAHESSIRVRIDAHTLWTPDTHEDHEP